MWNVDYFHKNDPEGWKIQEPKSGNSIPHDRHYDPPYHCGDWMVRHRVNMIELLMIWCCLDFPKLWAQPLFSSPKHPQSTDCSRLVQPARALVLLQIQRVVPTHSRGQGEGGTIHTMFLIRDGQGCQRFRYSNSNGSTIRLCIGIYI